MTDFDRAAALRERLQKIAGDQCWGTLFYPEVDGAIVGAIRAAVAAEREEIVGRLQSLADKVSDWADRDGPESVAAIKESTYLNVIAAIRNRS